mmetsp:Transcript_7746/g.27114  ORF Transcript_7746/g.27114 Transcript_7746/m.27114 type:complete len:244 (-) Transcript_7746:40-771(-)
MTSPSSAASSAAISGSSRSSSSSSSVSSPPRALESLFFFFAFSDLRFLPLGSSSSSSSSNPMRNVSSHTALQSLLFTEVCSLWWSSKILQYGSDVPSPPLLESALTSCRARMTTMVTSFFCDASYGSSSPALGTVVGSFTSTRGFVRHARKSSTVPPPSSAYVARTGFLSLSACMGMETLPTLSSALPASQSQTETTSVSSALSTLSSKRSSQMGSSSFFFTVDCARQPSHRSTTYGSVEPLP